MITVNAWKKQQISGQLLDLWINYGGDWWLETLYAVMTSWPPPVMLPVPIKCV
jgi:hypothetical protein